MLNTSFYIYSIGSISLESPEAVTTAYNIGVQQVKLDGTDKCEKSAMINSGQDRMSPESGC